jgi:serine phosphatase RsbU (regulator of sigma subunit)
VTELELKAAIRQVRDADLDPEAVRALLDRLEQSPTLGDADLAYDRVAAILTGFKAAVDEFRQVSSVAKAEDRQLLLRTARSRFAIQMSALLTESDVPYSSITGPHNSSSVNRMHHSLREVAGRVGALVESAIADSSARKELELAGIVQTMLVPPPNGVRVSALRTWAWFESAAQCSGDWWSADPLGEGDVFVHLGDVSGHGMPAALVAGMAKGACEMARLGMRGTLLPKQLLTMLNRVLADAVRGEYLMTFVAARFHFDKNVLSIANAGHRAVWHWRKGKLRIITGNGDPPLGARPVHRFDEQYIELVPGDLVFLFTDGIPECVDAQDRAFGERALREVVSTCAERGAEAVRDGVREAVTAHRGDRPAMDDLTLVCLEFST